jgi:hypothetical protein
MYVCMSLSAHPRRLCRAVAFVAGHEAVHGVARDSARPLRCVPVGAATRWSVGQSDALGTKAHIAARCVSETFPMARPAGLERQPVHLGLGVELSVHLGRSASSQGQRADEYDIRRHGGMRSVSDRRSSNCVC